MAFNDTIVKFINESLRQSSLKGQKFQSGVLHGIVSAAARKNAKGDLEIIPAVVSNAGEYKTVEPNDKYPFVCYHKQITNGYQFVKNDSYGDGFSIKATSEMAMIIWADNKKLGLSADQVEALFIVGLPQVVSKEEITKMKIRNGVITPITTDMDKIKLYRQEYQNVELNLKPEHTFFQLRYRVELVYTPACLLECSCGSNG